MTGAGGENTSTGLFFVYPSAVGIDVIGLDADDTLWPTAYLYTQAIEQFSQMMSDLGDPQELKVAIETKHSENAATFGFGSLPMMMTLTETATELTKESDGVRLKAVYAWIVQVCRWIHNAEIAPYPGVEPALRALREAGKHLIVITKGVHAEQMGKLARSGLQSLVDGVVVVAHKDAATYRGLITSMGIDASRFLMIGDSISGDVLPVLEIGGHAVLNNVNHNWEDQRQGIEIPSDVPIVESLAELPELLAYEYEPSISSPLATPDDPEATYSEISDDPEPSEPPGQPIEIQSEPEPDSPDAPMDDESQSPTPSEHPALKPAYQHTPAEDVPPGDDPNDPPAIGKWEKRDDGGYEVRITSEAFPIRTILNVEVHRSKDDRFSVKKVRVYSSDPETNSCLGLVMGDDGKPAPVFT